MQAKAVLGVHAAHIFIVQIREGNLPQKSVKNPSRLCRNTQLGLRSGYIFMKKIIDLHLAHTLIIFIATYLL